MYRQHSMAKVKLSLWQRFTLIFRKRKLRKRYKQMQDVAQMKFELRQRIVKAQGAYDVIAGTIKEKYGLDPKSLLGIDKRNLK